MAQPYCGWLRNPAISHQFETMGNNCSLAFTVVCFLGGAKWVSPIHSYSANVHAPHEDGGPVTLPIAVCLGIISQEIRLHRGVPGSRKGPEGLGRPEKVSRSPSAPFTNFFLGEGSLLK